MRWLHRVVAVVAAVVFLPGTLRAAPDAGTHRDAGLPQGGGSPRDGGASQGAERDTRLRVALAGCGPGDAVVDCAESLRKGRIESAVDGEQVIVALGGAFFAVVLDGRGGERIVDVAFRAVNLPGDLRGEIGDWLESHISAFPFSEDCHAGSQFCGVFFPKQKGGAGAVEVGVGLLAVTGAPVWRKPPALALVAGEKVYKKGERLLDLRLTPSESLIVQFSLPLGRDGKPVRGQPLLRSAFDAFAKAPFIRHPPTE